MSIGLEYILLGVTNKKFDKKIYYLIIITNFRFKTLVI